MSRSAWLLLALLSSSCAAPARAPSRVPGSPATATRSEPAAEPAAACRPEWVLIPLFLHFALDSDAVVGEERELLAQLIHTLGERDVVLRVRVEGHAQPCGAERDPGPLSLRRAEAVRDELRAVFEDPPEILVLAHGDRLPRNDRFSCDEAGRRALGEQNALTMWSLDARVETAIELCLPPGVE